MPREAGNRRACRRMQGAAVSNPPGTIGDEFVGLRHFATGVSNAIRDSRMPSPGPLLAGDILQRAASELTADSISVIELGTNSEDIGGRCNSDPTLSETVREAALNTEKRALYVINW